MYNCKCKHTRVLLSLFLVIITFTSLTGQEGMGLDSLVIQNDTLISPEIIDSLSIYNGQNIEFNTEEAIEYLSRWYLSDLWNNQDDPLRIAIGRLLFEAMNDPLFETELYLNEYDYEQIRIPASSFYLWDTLHIYLSYVSF